MTKDKKDLETFKVGDSHREGMSKPVESTRSSAQREPEAYSLGFARIEAMLEKEDPVAVGESLSNVLKELEAYGEAAATNKEKLAAKRAIAAVERAVDLMDYLFQTKSAMESNLL